MKHTRWNALQDWFYGIPWRARMWRARRLDRTERGRARLAAEHARRQDRERARWQADY